MYKIAYNDGFMEHDKIMFAPDEFEALCVARALFYNSDGTLRNGMSTVMDMRANKEIISVTSVCDAPGYGRLEVKKNAPE